MGVDMPRPVDILVRADDPELLDRRVRALAPAAVIGGGGDAPQYAMREGCYVVRCFGNPGYLKYAIEHQGYGEVVRQLDEIA